MKRSEINRSIEWAICFAGEQNFSLPPFAYWEPGLWDGRAADCEEIRVLMLGWDVTDFGHGNFTENGLTCFTLRNGKDEYPFTRKTYAEKVLFSMETQITPYHFHWNKTEDIINRGGGHLCIQLYTSTEEAGMGNTDITVSIDGCRRTCPAGTIVRLLPGESICIPPLLYHQFWAESGFGPVLLGEVSTPNNDLADNRFYHPSSRFTTVEEDAPRRYLLCNEYPAK